MAIQTDPRQPVVFDMMLLADSLVALRRFSGVKQRHLKFCERQKNFEEALTKIRCLAQFMQPKKRNDLINVADPEFRGVADKSFVQSHFVTISKYVSHLSEQRYKKEDKYPRPTASTAIIAGKQLLKRLKPVIDQRKHELKGDAAHWYSVFEDRYKYLFTKSKKK